MNLTLHRTVILPGRALAALVLIVCLVGFCRADVLISEFMADNESTLQDGDGNCSDWIELYNTSSNAADITGWHLTDDTNDPQQWQFPATNIAGNGFLLIFASGQPGDDYVDALGYLHTNFKLSRNDGGQHESVTLVEPDGTTIAHAFVDYPEQLEDVSYGLAQETASTNLVADAHDALALIPTAAVTNWTEVAFDDSGWLTGQTGVGYEHNVGYGHLINLDVIAMRGVNASVYARIRFETADPAAFNSLTLRMKYDDGFIAYINGVEGAATNAPASPQWNSQATASHEADTVTYEEFDVSSVISALQPGANVLAIHGLNTPIGSSDMLILPELVAVVVGNIQTNSKVFFAAPTPGAANTAGVLGFVDALRFSVERGFFSNAFEVAITTATVGVEIYYSLDGSTPSSSNATPYSSAIAVSNTTILRAAAFKAGYTSSKAATHTYIFVADVITQSPNGEVPGPNWPSAPINGQVFDYGMDPDVVNDSRYADLIDDALLSIPTFSLVTDADNLFDPDHGIYVNARDDGGDWERPASVELIYPGGSMGFQVNAGLRIRGGMSRNPNNPKHSFRMFFRSEYGDAKLYYPLFGDEGVEQFDKLDLRTGQNFSWHLATGGNQAYSTWLYDIFARDVHRDMGQPYTRGSYCHVYLNGQYWGLYQTEERPESRYAESYYGGDDGDYDAVKSGDFHGEIEATDGSLDSYYQLWAEINAGMTDNSNYFRIQGLNADGTCNPSYTKLLDVDNLIDYMIPVFYGGNRDMPLGPPGGDNLPNNLFAIFNREDPDGFKFIAHDSEHVLGAHLPDGVDFDRVNVALIPSLGQQQKCNPWWIHLQLIADNAEYRLRFADRVHRYFFNDGALTPPESTNRFLARAAEMNLAIIAESARWGDYLTPSSPRTKDDDWLPTVNNIVDNYLVASPQTRTDVVLNQLIGQGWYPGVDAPTFSRHGGAFTNGFALSITSSDPVYYTLDGTDPREIGTGNPTGILYTDAVALPYSVQVKARALNGATWSALNSAVFVLDETTPLRVTEIMYHPADPGRLQTNYTAGDFEFIELRNVGTQTVGLAGVAFTEGIVFDFTESNVSSLETGEYVVLVNDQFAFAERYTNWSSINIAGEFHGRFFLPGALDNDGETIALVDGLGNTIQSFDYEDAWYPATDGSGYSLTLIDPYADTNDWNLRGAWRASTYVGGTPGGAPVDAPPVSVVINEFLAINDTISTDEFGDYDDWIELFNYGTNDATLTGVYLTDDLNNPAKWAFPETNLSPGAFLVIWADNETNEGPLHAAFKLSGSGEEIGLYNSAALGTTLIHYVEFAQQTADVSFGMFPDGIGGWGFLTTPTPGTNNIVPEPGAVCLACLLTAAVFAGRRHDRTLAS